MAAASVLGRGKGGGRRVCCVCGEERRGENKSRVHKSRVHKSRKEERREQ